jgi:hypothetical protein
MKATDPNATKKTVANWGRPHLNHFAPDLGMPPRLPKIEKCSSFSLVVVSLPAEFSMKVNQFHPNRQTSTVP